MYIMMYVIVVVFRGRVCIKLPGKVINVPHRVLLPCNALPEYLQPK